MLRLFRNRVAQSTMEYAILISVVIGAFTAMQLYLRRGINARLKEGMDNIPGAVLSKTGDNSVTDLFAGGEAQYEPYYYGATNMVTTSSEGTELGAYGVQGGFKEVTGARQARTGYQTTTGVDNGN